MKKRPPKRGPKTASELDELHTKGKFPEKSNLMNYSPGQNGKGQEMNCPRAAYPEAGQGKTIDPGGQARGNIEDTDM